MNTERIKEIQKETGYPDSVAVQQALLKVWNETGQRGTIEELEEVMYGVCDSLGVSITHEESELITHYAKAIKDFINK